MNVVTSDWESACDLELERAPYEGQLYGVLGAPFFLFQHGPDGVRQISTLLKDLHFDTKLVHTGNSRSDWTPNGYRTQGSDEFGMSYTVTSDLSDKMIELLLTDPEFARFERFQQGMIARLQPTRTVVERIATVHDIPDAARDVRNALDSHVGRIVWARAAYTAQALGKDTVNGPPVISVREALDAAEKYGIPPEQSDLVYYAA